MALQISDPDLRHEIQAHLDELLTTGQLLEAAAEHAFALALANGRNRSHPLTKDLDPSA